MRDVDDVVRIVLDGGSTLAAGGLVSGAVVFTADRSCRAVEVALLWRTRGTGAVDQGEVRARLTLPARIGIQPTRVPFALRLPMGPVTFRGQLILLDWFVRASVDIAYASDRHTEVPIVVMPARSGFSSSAGYREAAVPVTTRHELGPQPKAPGRPASGLAGNIITAVVLIGPLAMLGPMRGLALATGAALTIWSLRALIDKKTVRRLLGNPVATLDQTEVRLGEDVGAHVHLRPLPGVIVGDVRATLECWEQISTGDGSSSRTERKITHSARYSLAPREGRYGARVPIPMNGVPSFGSPHNEITWTVKLSITGMRGTRPLAHEEELVVRVQPR